MSEYESVVLGDMTLSRIAYGCWRLDDASIESVTSKLSAAFEAGIHAIDTAPIYGYGKEGFGHAEQALGNAFAQDAQLRGQCVLVTKAGIQPPIPYDSSKAAIIASCEASLKRLQTDVIDIFLIHRPDVLTHPEELAGALIQLREQGKIREAGVSNYSVPQTQSLQSFLGFKLVVTQPECSPMETRIVMDGTLDYCQQYGVTPMVWSPLAGGDIVTAMSHSNNQAKLDRVIKAIDKVAEQYDTARDIIALAWLLRHPSKMIPIIGSQKPKRIKSAAKALSVMLNRAEWYSIFEASLDHKMP